MVFGIAILEQRYGIPSIRNPFFLEAKPNDSRSLADCLEETEKTTQKLIVFEQGRIHGQSVVAAGGQGQ